MMKYLICKNGSRVTVGRSDRNNNFGTVINERDTYKDAILCAKVERMVLKHIANKETLT